MSLIRLLLLATIDLMIPNWWLYRSIQVHTKAVACLDLYHMSCQRSGRWEWRAGIISRHPSLLVSSRRHDKIIWLVGFMEVLAIQHEKERIYGDGTYLARHANQLTIIINSVVFSRINKYYGDRLVAFFEDNHVLYKCTLVFIRLFGARKPG